MNLALRQWRETFAQEPVVALDRLVRGLAPVGTAAQLSLGELLSLAFERGDPALDAAVRTWLDAQILQPIPSRITPGRWSVLLAEFLRGIVDWRLTETGALLRERHHDIRLWLRGLYEGPDRDPEGAYLLALACHQADQRFSPLWRRLILAEEMPERPWRSVGMLGFSKMPDALGRPAADTPDGLLRALVELADKDGMRKAVWQQAIRSVFAAYPSSEGYWVKRFAEIAESSSGEIVHLNDWLRPILPPWRDYNERQGRHTGGGFISSSVLPNPGEFRRWLDRLQEHPELCETEECNQFLDRYRAFTRATGYTYFLVRTFNNIATKIKRRDRSRSVWALGLVKEALDWDRRDPKSWTIYAQTLTAAKCEDDALRTLWHARYRFPWDNYIRNELGRLLRETGDFTTSAAVLHEAASHFPNDDVCRNSLSETLRAMGQQDEARTVLQETRRRFPSDIFCRTSLGNLLLDANELDASEAVFREAIGIDSRNPFARTGIAKVWFVRSAQMNNERLREQSRRLLEEVAADGDQVARSRLSHFDDWWAKGAALGAAFRPENVETTEPRKITPKQRRIEDMSPVEQLGRSLVALWQAERADDTAERDRLCNLALRLLDVPENQMGELLTGFVETRGLVYLARGEAEAALGYFTDQIERLGRGGWIGVRLGEIRARIALGETPDVEAESALFDSGHARFIFHVAEVIVRLAHDDSTHQELARLLKELYPRAEKMAAAEAHEEKTEADEEHEAAKTAKNTSEALAQFIHARWFQPAQIHSKSDLDDADALGRLASQIEKSRKDTLDLLTDLVPALAA